MGSVVTRVLPSMRDAVEAEVLAVISDEVAVVHSSPNDVNGLVVACRGN